MRCPKCGCEEIKVVDTRAGKNKTSIRRRRECLDCNHRFSTIEEIQKEDLVVIKRDGRREEFDRMKLLKGLTKALEKRPVDSEQIESIVQKAVHELQNKYDTEIPSGVIGETIMKHLKALDQIAYVRFASVYKEFHDISQIAQEIKDLGKNE